MRTFFKIFFANLLALFVFCFIGCLILAGAVSGLTARANANIPNKSALLLDLDQHFAEQAENDPLCAITRYEESCPGFYDVLRLIQHAKSDNKISGIYITGDGNANGQASSNELRLAIKDFKKSKKWVIAHADLLTQGLYSVGIAADKIYINPVGAMDWSGFNVRSEERRVGKEGRCWCCS